MDEKKIYTSDDIAVCGFVMQKLFAEAYPNGLTASEIKTIAAKRKWMKRVYDMVVVVDGIL